MERKHWVPPSTGAGRDHIPTRFSLAGRIANGPLFDELPVNELPEQVGDGGPDGDFARAPIRDGFLQPDRVLERDDAGKPAEQLEQDNGSADLRPAVI